MNLHEVKVEEPLVMEFLRARFNNPNWNWRWHDNHPCYQTTPGGSFHHMGATELQIWQNSATAWASQGRGNTHDYF